MQTHQKVYAVLRHDRFQDASAPIDVRVKVVRVLVSEAEAEAEVARLNQLNGDKDVEYFMQATQLK
jgi:hypothetical protein